jgi:hypothetical protein
MSVVCCQEGGLTHEKPPRYPGDKLTNVMDRKEKLKRPWVECVITPWAHTEGKPTAVTAVSGCRPHRLAGLFNGQRIRVRLNYLFKLVEQQMA